MRVEGGAARFVSCRRLFARTDPPQISMRSSSSSTGTHGQAGHRGWLDEPVLATAGFAPGRPRLVVAIGRPCAYSRGGSRSPTMPLGPAGPTKWHRPAEVGAGLRPDLQADNDRSGAHIGRARAATREAVAGLDAEPQMARSRAPPPNTYRPGRPARPGSSAATRSIRLAFARPRRGGQTIPPGRNPNGKLANSLAARSGSGGLPRLANGLGEEWAIPSSRALRVRPHLNENGAAGTDHGHGK